MDDPASVKKARFSFRGVCIVLGCVLFSLIIAYVCWSPGAPGPLPPGKTHGAWLTHAWWGDDVWYADSSRKRADYFGAQRVAALAKRLHGLGIRDWYIHAGPARGDGALPVIDVGQARLLVEANQGGQVLAWVGGVLDVHCPVGEVGWRRSFVVACADLVKRTGIAGIQLNIEPCPPRTTGYLELLDELKAGLPSGSRLSVAAYPPPTALHRAPAVHWGEEYFREVSRRSDDLCVMAYDTALRTGKPYTWLVANWTRECLAWSVNPVRIGLPAYAEFGKPWHHPQAENLAHAFPGLCRGFAESSPTNYAGWAVYAEWTMTGRDEDTVRTYQPDVPSAGSSSSTE
jgi:hypothetical protein